MKDEQNGIDSEAPVKVFVHGINRWRDEQESPPARSKPTPWYLGANGGFSPTEPLAGESPDSYVYDPEDPCPSCGGNLLMPAKFMPGPVDQAPILDRRDVLAYTSTELSEDLELAGNVSAVLYASTSALLLKEATSVWWPVVMPCIAYGHSLEIGLVSDLFSRSTSGA